MPRSLYLWCPAYSLVDHQQVERALAGATVFAEGTGLVLAPSPALAVHRNPGDWPPAEDRLADLRRGLGHQVLLAARGGYGCLDLLPAMVPSPSLPFLIGYSDLTVLHAAWAVTGAGETLYGFMPGVDHGPRALDSAVRMFNGEGNTLGQAGCPEAAVVRAGTAEGPLFAACLRVLTGLVGTPWMPCLAGRVLALEDIDERPYRIDRDLHQLFLAGALDGVVALVTNAFPCTLPPGYLGPGMAAVVARWAERLAIPALVGVPFGHHADPLTLPNGRRTRLEADDHGWRLVIAPR
jgi:muramoyltetrapeptide carboxypeptidase